MTFSAFPKPSIGIIGGRGQFGRWCQNLFERLGHSVCLSDVGTDLSNEDLVRRVEVVIVSVPIGVTGAVLAEVLPVVRSEQLLIDLTSVKTPFVQQLLTAPCEVLSLHPMFAPSTPSQGQTCVTCRVRAGKLSQYFEDAISAEGITLTEMSPEEHDRMMAVVQGLTHFQAIAGAHCMAVLGFDTAQSLRIASPVYRMRLAMMGRILEQNPRLYAEIQIFNPFVREVLLALLESSRKLSDIIDRGDVDGFVREFESARSRLGKFP
jgi:prephenate dehydrogenase